LIRGLLAYNLGENLDDLQCVVVPNNDGFVRGANMSADFENVWTCIFMDIQLEDVILDIVPQRKGEVYLMCLNTVGTCMTLEVG